MIVTARARWLVILVVMTSIIALWQQYAFLLQLSIATLLWIGFEWITFHYRVDSIFARLDAHRTLNSPQGPVRTLWESRPVGVETRLTLARPLLAFLRPVLSPLQAHVQDVLPTSVEQLDGASGRTVSLGDVTEFSLSYRIRPPTSGAVNFFWAAVCRAGFARPFPCRTLSSSHDRSFELCPWGWMPAPSPQFAKRSKPLAATGHSQSFNARRWQRTAGNPGLRSR